MAEPINPSTVPPPIKEQLEQLDQLEPQESKTRKTPTNIGKTDI